jgi:hypothetical protein
MRRVLVLRGSAGNAPYRDRAWLTDFAKLTDLAEPADLTADHTNFAWLTDLADLTADIAKPADFAADHTDLANHTDTSDLQHARFRPECSDLRSIGLRGQHSSGGR